jgi:predicted esterase
MTREDREKDIQDYVAYLDTVAAHVSGAQAKRLRVLGFSQGCATVFRWAVLGETRIDELIMWSGEVPPDADLARSAQRLANTRITIVSGARDEQAPTAAAQRQVHVLKAAGLASEIHEHDGGHRIDSNLLTALAARS